VSASLARRIVESAVDVGDLFHPFLALRMLHIQNAVERPVKVKREIGYLLTQTI
jgi:hypothetical protein